MSLYLIVLVISLLIAYSCYKWASRLIDKMGWALRVQDYRGALVYQRRKVIPMFGIGISCLVAGLSTAYLIAGLFK